MFAVICSWNNYRSSYANLTLLYLSVVPNRSPSCTSGIPHNNHKTHLIFSISSSAKMSFIRLLDLMRCRNVDFFLWLMPMNPNELTLGWAPVHILKLYWNLDCSHDRMATQTALRLDSNFYILKYPWPNVRKKYSLWYSFIWKSNEGSTLWKTESLTPILCIPRTASRAKETSMSCSSFLKQQWKPDVFHYPFVFVSLQETVELRIFQSSRCTLNNTVYAFKSSAAYEYLGLAIVKAMTKLSGVMHTSHSEFQVLVIKSLMSKLAGFPPYFPVWEFHIRLWKSVPLRLYSAAI